MDYDTLTCGVSHTHTVTRRG